MLEGSIVRAVTRIDEACREVRNCAGIIGMRSLPTQYYSMSRDGTFDCVIGVKIFLGADMDLMFSFCVVIGDTQLFTKMENASKMIKRDIVFAASLYVQ